MKALLPFSRALPLVAACMLMLPSVGRAQLSIDRGEMELIPGASAERRVGLLTVRNAGTARVQAVVSMEDWDRGIDGGNRFFPVGKLMHSCGEGLRVFPASFALEAGDATQVRIEYVGTPRRDECTNLIVVEEAKPSTVKRTGISVNTRMGLKVYVTPSETTTGGELTDLAIERPAQAGDSTRVVTTYRNDGTRHVQATGRLEIRRDDNSVVTTVTLPTVYALAGASMQTRAALPPLSPGKYVLIAIYDFGGSELAAAQLEVDITP